MLDWSVIVLPNIQIDKINEEIMSMLNIYDEDLKKAVFKDIDKFSNMLKAETKATAPVGKRKKHYKDNISIRKGIDSSSSHSKIWCVKAPDYRLSHLLENGHALQNGGRVEGTHFIQKSCEKIFPLLESKIKEDIKNVD